MNFPAIIGLSGYAQVGKDTVAAILHDLYGYERVSFADQLRNFIYRQDLYLPDGRRLNEVVDDIGWDKAKQTIPYVRKVQQTTGTDAGRTMKDTIWVDAAMDAMPTGKLVVFPDMRFPNEMAAIRERGGACWRVKRPGVEPVNPHPSETALDHVEQWDQVIDNDDDIEHLALALATIFSEHAPALRAKDVSAFVDGIQDTARAR